MEQRIHYINKPGNVLSAHLLERQVATFISQEKANRQDENSLRYQIRYGEGESIGIGVAFIKVYKRNPDDPNGQWDLFGFYNAGEIKRFAAELKRSTDDNPTGAVELSGNLLFNGFFNLFPDALDGWSITDDSTSGTASITPNGDRLEITSTGTGTLTITNTKTTLENLLQYTSTIAIHKLEGTGDLTLNIGGSAGTTRSAAGVFNEDIVSGGTEVTLTVNITVADSKFILDYILISRAN